MTVSELKKQIKGNLLQKFYIFSGTETYVQNLYAKKIAETSGAIFRRPESVSDVLNTRGSSFIKQKYCYFVRDDEVFMKNESLWDKIESLLGDNILIVIVTEPDKRSVFYKHFQDQIIVFESLVDSTIIRHIKQEIELSKNNIQALIDVCDSNYSQILTEVDKINQYSKANDISPDDAFVKLWEDNLIHRPVKDVVFDFVAAVGLCKPRTSFALMSECLENGDGSLKLISLLYTQFKHILQVQSCSSTDIAKATGLSDWEIKLVRDKVNIYHNWELIDFLKLLKKLETGIKTGEMEEVYVMDYLMVYVLGG